jgi:hypothetical protein
MKNLLQITLVTFGFFFLLGSAAVAQNTLDDGFGQDLGLFLEDENIPDSDVMNDQIRLTVYPSPANGDQIQIKYDNLIASSTVTVYDANGRPVHTKTVGNERDNNGIFNMAISDLSSGFYIVKLVSGHLETMQKILIQK